MGRRTLAAHAVTLGGGGGDVGEAVRAVMSAQSEMESPTEVAMEAEIRRSQWLVNPLAAVRERLTLLEESVLDDSEDDDEKAVCLEASAEVSFKPIDKLYEIANDSFYFRVSARIMHEPLRLKSFGYWLLTLLCMYLQILCLTTVWFSTWWQYANSVWYDDESEEVTEAYPAGLSYPQNWRETLKYYNTLYFGVSSVVLVPLVLCSTMLMYSVSVETKQIKASAMILYDFTSRTPTQRSCAARAAVVAKIFMCWTIFLMRVTNVWYYKWLQR